MKNPVAGICLAVLFLSLFPSPGASQTEIQIFRAGQFHGKEVSATSGETWFGLYPVADGFELIPSRITVEIVHDAIIDQPDQKTGKQITVDQPKEPLFLVKGLESLKRGPVKTVFQGHKFLYPAESVSFQLEKDWYSLHAFGEAVDRETGIEFHRYTLKFSFRPQKLSFKPQNQLIASLDLTNDGHPTLLWAGDLDRDGRLDLLMDLTDHYNMMLYTLFLSSMAGEGELLRKVAQFRTTGC